MISEDVLKYRKGFFIREGYETAHFRSSTFPLTLPFAEHGNHINGIENFWNQAKRHMRKFNGVPKVQFGLYLKVWAIFEGM